MDNLVALLIELVEARRERRELMEVRRELIEVRREKEAKLKELRKLREEDDQLK